MTPFVLRPSGGWRKVGLTAAGAAITASILRPSGYFVALVIALVAFSAARAVRERLELRSDGSLVSRGVLVNSGGSVGLQSLRRVECREVVRRSGGSSRSAPRLVSHHEMRIADERGRSLTIEPAHWDKPDVIVAAVASAAADQGVEVLGGELFGIVEPTPRSREASAAEPAGRPSDLGVGAFAVPGTAPLLDEPLGGPVSNAVETRLRLPYRLFPFAVSGFGVLVVPLQQLVLGVARGWPVGPIAAALVVAAAAASVIAWTGTSLRTEPSGRLEVRSWPPFVTRTVRLDRLLVVEARAGRELISKLPGGHRRNALIWLRDDEGGDVRMILDAWQDSEWLLEVLHEWTRRGGVAVDGPTRRLLVRGETPQPTANDDFEMDT